MLLHNNLHHGRDRPTHSEVTLQWLTRQVGVAELTDSAFRRYFLQILADLQSLLFDIFRSYFQPLQVNARFFEIDHEIIFPIPTYSLFLIMFKPHSMLYDLLVKILH